jgi:hypothetical protein
MKRRVRDSGQKSVASFSVEFKLAFVLCVRGTRPSLTCLEEGSNVISVLSADRSEFLDDESQWPAVTGF